MINNPKAEEIAQAVAGWIEQLRPSLPPRDAFRSRVAGNARATIIRELQQGPAVEKAATARMAQVLGHDGDYADLLAELCQKLRHGELTETTPGVMAALRANTLEQLAIDQPNYKHETSAT